MNELSIVGRISSLNVRKVVLAVQWLELPYERVDAGMQFGLVDTPEYRAQNPNGLVPLLVDGAFALWESNVIVRYVCAKHSLGALYPEALEALFDAERWMDWQQTTLNPAGRGAFVQLIRTAPEQRDQLAIERSIARTEPLLALLDEQLASRSHIAGDAFTMADIPIACEVHRYRALPIPQRAYARLDRWYERIAREPAARGVLDLTLS
jgi:glutathione S-transferase